MEGNSTAPGPGVLPWAGKGAPLVLETPQGPCLCLGQCQRQGDTWCPRMRTPHSAQGHTQQCTVGPRNPGVLHPEGGPGDPQLQPSAPTLVRGVSCCLGSSRVKRGEL